MTDSTPASAAPDREPVPSPLPDQPRPWAYGPVGKVREPWFVVVMSIITLGIYFLYWTYQVFRELREHTGEGIGGVLGLVIALLLGIVNWFVLPAEIGTMYSRAGMPPPVRGVTGFWHLLPLVGSIVWVVKVQRALNRRWASPGDR
jgi:hypothetical protein